MSIIAMLTAIPWCARNLKRLLASRKQVQRRRTVTDTELLRLGVVGGLRQFLAEILRIFSMKPLKLTEELHTRLLAYQV